MFELLTPAEMQEADRLTIAGGRPGIDLMERAGQAIAEAIGGRHPASARVLVVAGPGNNGGDGFVAARLLAAKGYSCKVLLLGKPEALKGDAALAGRAWQGPCEDASPDAIGSFAPDVIIDALFGAGLDRPVTGAAGGLIEAMNATGRPILAVDLPSGIDGRTGAVMGVAVQADQTVTFFRRKPGHLLLPGRLHCGREVRVADIGIPAAVLSRIAPATFANGPALWGDHFPIPQTDSHKYRRGHAVVLSGGASSTGAARLAARGALRAGAGLVTLASPPDAMPVNAAASLAVMVHRIDGAAGFAGLLADPRKNAVVIGPGGGVGESLLEHVLAALTGPRGVVLDADALTSFAGDPGPLFSAIRGRDTATILTPHEGEFSRLFNILNDSSHVKQKLELAREAATISAAVVVLKGPDTVVAAPDGRASIAGDAPPWLATAGSGDVLAGFIAGLLAQGMPGFEAASAAVWLHGEAATAFGPGLISEDIPEALPVVYRRLFNWLENARRAP